jgi:hypothetical protein
VQRPCLTTFDLLNEVGKAWISLDSLVLNETFQWVTGEFRGNFFSRAQAPRRAREVRPSVGRKPTRVNCYLRRLWLACLACDLLKELMREEGIIVAYISEYWNIYPGSYSDNSWRLGRRPVEAAKPSWPGLSRPSTWFGTTRSAGISIIKCAVESALLGAFHLTVVPTVAHLS